MRTIGSGAASVVLLLSGWLLLATDAWARIGWIERMQGAVSVDLPQGGTHALVVGDPLEEGQSVRTGPDGEAVVHFVDNAIMIVRPASQVRVSAYHYTDNDPGSASLIRLVKGGLRFVTGLMGKLNHDNVQFETVVATIGIRGTDFDTVFRDKREDNLDAGSYTCVTEGGTFMRDTSGKQVEIAAGQTAFMTNADYIAKGLATATSIGLMQAPNGMFRAGTFDGEVQHLKEEGLRQLQNRINEKVPSALQGVVPGADALVSGAGDLVAGMFGKKKKKHDGASPCAT